MTTITDRIAAVHERIALAARRSGRAPEHIRLVGVSKTHPPETIAEALAAGLAHFGENRVQEADDKITALASERARITWHLIGHLQSNKAKRAAALFDLVHSVDSLKLAQALDRYAEEEEKRRRGEKEKEFSASPLLPFSASSPLPVLLQVNVSGEASKEGFDLAGWEQRPAVLEQFAATVEQLLALPGLRVDGLMTIAPWGQAPEQARPTFRSARLLRDELSRRFPQTTWEQLSMGMTDDFEVAIEEGATIVRVGRALFGARS
jgi:PLP dependent protein